MPAPHMYGMVWYQVYEKKRSHRLRQPCSAAGGDAHAELHAGGGIVPPAWASTWPPAARSPARQSMIHPVLLPGGPVERTTSDPHRPMMA